MNNQKKINTILLVLLAVVCVFLLQLSIGSNLHPQSHNQGEHLEAQVISVVNESDIQILETVITKGSMSGQILEIENDLSVSANSHSYSSRDNIVVAAYENPLNGEKVYYVLDYARRSILLWSFAIFILLVIAVTRWQGLRSLLGMVFSFLVVLKFLLPLLLLGYSSLLVTLRSAALILPAIFYLSHGVNLKTSIALVSTLLVLFITALIALVFTKVGQFSGLSSESAAFLKLDSSNSLNFQGLLLSGVIVSLLGILDDVTISQVSIVPELKS